MRFGGFFEGGGDSVGRNVEVFTEVVNSLVGEEIVVPLPRELVLDEASGLERLHNLDNVEVGDFDLCMLLQSQFLVAAQDALFEEVRVDS